MIIIVIVLMIITNYKYTQKYNNKYNNNNGNDNLREFACHTTVILAQPRVSRLRAAAGYVLRRASWAAADIVDFQMPVWRGPPFFWSPYTVLTTKKRPIGS